MINIEQLVQQAVAANAELIAENVREQLSKGQSGDGKAVGIYQSVWYAQMKSKMNSLPFGTVDLKLSGSLYENLKTEITDTTVSTDSAVSYSDIQKKRYGDKIYDNTKENQQEVRETVSLQSVRNYSKALGL
jgi:hypothetical protein